MLSGKQLVGQCKSGIRLSVGAGAVDHETGLGALTGSRPGNAVTESWEVTGCMGQVSQIMAQQAGSYSQAVSSAGSL